MSAVGLAVVALLTAVFVLWVLNLVRLGRLYVGYATLLIASVLVAVAGISLEPLRRNASALVAAHAPGFGGVLVLAALCVGALTYLLTQQTVLSNRLSTLVQEIALQRDGDVGKPGSGGPDADPSRSPSASP